MLSHLVQFVLQPVAVDDVLLEQVLELPQEIARPRGIVPVAFQFGDDPALPQHMRFAFGDVVLGLPEMTFNRVAVHAPL